jgi:hypothetical protein
VHLRIFSLFAVLLAAAVVVGGSGAGTAKTRTATKIDVSTRSAVIHYLRSIHVNPRGVVIQRGARNYAGARCPGKRWSCASTRHAVVQIAAPGGKNSFSCSTASCAVVQVAAAAPAKPNKAVCIKTTGISGTCVISQSSSSVDNIAGIYQKAAKTNGLTQTASYTASITQTASGASNKNQACVTQDVTIDSSTNVSAKKGQPVTITTRGHQSISIEQNSFGGNSAAQGTDSSGNCVGDTIVQNQTLTSTAYGTGPITQLQNDGGDPVPGPNLTLNLKQNQGAGYLNVAGGTNTMDFSQVSTLVADASGGMTGSGFSTNGPVSQTQGKADGGLEATVNQFSTVFSTIDANQAENQCEHAQKTGTVPGDLAGCLAVARTNPLPNGWTQTQFGPMRKGGTPSTQGNFNQDSFTVTQNTTQKTDIGGETQNNVVQGDCATTGNCDADQHADVNGQTADNSASGSNVTLETFCNGTSCVTFNGPQISVTNTDVAESGYGGMRGDGTGTVTVSGLPVGASITKAFLWWNGPTNSTDPAANATVTFNGTSITGTNIGISGDNNWGFQNSQSYRADVTGLVTGNGSYTLADFLKAGGIDINGVGLMVFYRDGTTANDRNVVLWNGNDSNCLAGGVPENWDETINGVPYNGGSASLDFIVGDGQSFSDGAIDINGLPFVAAGQNFDGDSTPAGPFAGNPSGVTGSLWDVKSFNGLESFLTSGTTTDLHLQSPAAGDCLSLVVAAANAPVSGPVILAPSHTAAKAARTTGPAQSAATGSGGVAR